MVRAGRRTQTQAYRIHHEEIFHDAQNFVLINEVERPQPLTN